MSDSAGPAAQRCDLLIHGARLITVDGRRRVFDPGAVAVSGHSIVACGPDREIRAAYHARETIDADGGVVHPGFIDAHNHIVHGSARGVFANADRSGGERVNFATFKADVSAADEQAATAVASLELLRNGFTGFVEPGSLFDIDAVVTTIEAVGLRACVAGTYLWDTTEVMALVGSLESENLFARAPPEYRRAEANLGKTLHRNETPGGRIHGFVCLYGLGTASDELQLAARSLADRHGVCVHQHEGYVPETTAALRQRLGKSPIRHLYELGVLGERSTLVHMNIFDDEDVELLAETGANVVWCPVAYFNLGLQASTPCPTPTLLDAGVHVALATDGARDCVIGDAALAAHLAMRSVRATLAPETIIEMQTIGAARAAGLDAITGSIESGKRADLVVRRCDSPAACPGINPVHQLALTDRAQSAVTVIVNGDVVLRNGCSTRVDEATVLRDARSSVESRMRRLDMASVGRWPVT